MAFYGRHILPRLLDAGCSNPAVAAVRETIVPYAEGVVVEIGIGSGLNLPHYNPSRIDRLIGVDPDDVMWQRSAGRRALLPFPIERIGLSGEAIPLEAAVADTVLVTFSLCSIADAVAALSEMRRVLKPGGRLLFAEHGAAPDASIRRWQRRLDPIWTRIAGGCHPGRPILHLLDDAGWRPDRVEQSYIKGPRPLAYVYRGSALPA